VCHFFVDPDTYPIYDSYCRDMIALHLGKGAYALDDQNPYRGFMANILNLRQLSGLNATLRDLDRYLWLGGQYRAWLQSDGVGQTNAELRSLFESEDSRIQSQLTELLPAALR
jgi:hypothetical protein